MNSNYSRCLAGIRMRDLHELILYRLCSHMSPSRRGDVSLIKDQPFSIYVYFFVCVRIKCRLNFIPANIWSTESGIIPMKKDIRECFGILSKYLPQPPPPLVLFICPSHVSISFSLMSLTDRDHSQWYIYIQHDWPQIIFLYAPCCPPPRTHAQWCHPSPPCIRAHRVIRLLIYGF